MAPPEVIVHVTHLGTLAADVVDQVSLSVGAARRGRLARPVGALPFVLARLAAAAMAQEPRELAHRLSRALIDDAVHHDDRDALGHAPPGAL
jgi:hypothetical protein